ncbi:hypothetical protein F5Y12DRAFT_796630 [Xylaria sp. FL1777]|nr:hypothetical protein F5Y12DRAFT_796630 [Xylaria sp. FL1777]
MAFSGEIAVDEVMADDELVANSDEMSFGFSEQEDENEDITSLQPKVPFKERVDAFITLEDKKFQKIENYFFSLLRAPGLSINHILNGTFDDHEITLITPQSGPPDVVRWQMRNAQRYHENLETRFKGHTDTMAFKMACLYFGFPVEPLRQGTTQFLLSPDPDPLERNDMPNPNPFKFLDVYNKGNEAVPEEKILSLRGGGEYTVNKKDNTVTWNPSAQNKKGGKKRAAKAEQAIQEISPEGYEMEGFLWTAQSQEIPTTKDNSPTPTIRLYGWQGAINTALEYRDFISNVDKLISNWDKIDQSIYVDIFRVSSVKIVETVRGFLHHRETEAPIGDAVWKVLKKYFGTGDTNNYACFIRLYSDGKENRPIGYQPSNKDKHVVRIENAENKDLAYMRVPSNLHADYKPHQFGREYMYAMQFFLLPYPPHALVVYQNGLIGDAYQYLDPPQELWEQVIDARNELGSSTKISFKIQEIDEDYTPVVIPGVSRLHNNVNRLDLRNGKTENAGAAESLGEICKAIELSLKEVNLKKECNGFEIWRQASDFKDSSKSSERITFSGNVKSAKSLESWQAFLQTLPNRGPLGFVVRPVFKTYRLLSPENEGRVGLPLNELDLHNFKAIVHNRLYGNYNPKDPSQVIVLNTVNQESFQAELTIQHNTTEDEWQWIRRNIIEPELIISVEDLGNEWTIPEKSAIWGPRYIANSYADDIPIPTETAGSSSKIGAFINKSSTLFDSDSSLSLSPVPVSAHTYTGHPPPPIPDGSGGAFTGFPPVPIHNVPGKTSRGNAFPFKKASSNAASLNEKDIKAGAKQKVLDYIFRNSKNTMGEAERVRELRSRTFTSASSIFTNPLKPVMPLYGPPLEPMIKTGPSMPGVSIAMMTPTEVLRLQQEVHSLRFQLLDRTRECPYADCDRYFTFSDGEGLDRHVREDHNTLRCFLCDKDQYLLPYYNAEKIREHFVVEHLDEIVKAFGGANIQKSSTPQAGFKPAKKTPQAVPLKHESSDESIKEESPEYVPQPTLQTPPKDQPANPKKNPWEHIVDQMTKGNDPWDSPQKPKEQQLPTPENSEPSKVWVKEFLDKLDQGEPLGQTQKPSTTAVLPLQDPSPAKKSFSKTTSKGAQTSFTKTADGKAEIFTIVNPNPGTFEQNGAWIKGQLEKYVADGGTTLYGLDTDKPEYRLFTAVNTKPGTFQQNDDFIREKIEEYIAEGGKLNRIVPGKEIGDGPGKGGGDEPGKESEDDPVRAHGKPEYKLFTAVNTKPGTFQQNDDFIRERIEEYIAEGGKLNRIVPQEESENSPVRAHDYKLFTEVNTKPGTFQQNDAFIREKIKEYIAEGGKLNRIVPGKESEDDPAPANLSTRDMSNPHGFSARAESAKGGEKKKKGAKRRRPADLDPEASVSDVYEYSERSAVPDPLANLAADAPPSPSPKRLRKTKFLPPPPTPVTPARSARRARPATVVTPLSSPSASDGE